MRTRGSFLHKFKNKLRTIPASAEEQLLAVNIPRSVQNSSKYACCINQPTRSTHQLISALHTSTNQRRLVSTSLSSHKYHAICSLIAF